MLCVVRSKLNLFGVISLCPHPSPAPSGSVLVRGSRVPLVGALRRDEWGSQRPAKKLFLFELKIGVLFKVLEEH